ncbi:hypothetical protein HK101_005091 [Irineochytrium annulatum]|nr:hypothetical protein HK101_005091 [Irineochytrium annulatum]
MGFTIDANGNILDADGNIVGSINGSTPLAVCSSVKTCAALGYSVDANGNILDADGKIIGSIHGEAMSAPCTDATSCAALGYTVDANGNIINAAGQIVGNTKGASGGTGDHVGNAAVAGSRPGVTVTVIAMMVAAGVMAFQLDYAHAKEERIRLDVKEVFVNLQEAQTLGKDTAFIEMCLQYLLQQREKIEAQVSEAQAEVKAASQRMDSLIKIPVVTWQKAHGDINGIRNLFLLNNTFHAYFDNYGNAPIFTLVHRKDLEKFDTNVYTVMVDMSSTHLDERLKDLHGTDIVRLEAEEQSLWPPHLKAHNERCPWLEREWLAYQELRGSAEPLGSFPDRRRDPPAIESRARANDDPQDLAWEMEQQAVAAEFVKAGGAVDGGDEVEAAASSWSLLSGSKSRRVKRWILEVGAAGHASRHVATAAECEEGPTLMPVREDRTMQVLSPLVRLEQGTCKGMETADVMEAAEKMRF